MKKLIENLFGLVVLVVMAYYVVTGVFNINIKNPFAGKSEVPDSMVEEMLAETTDSIAGSVHGAREATYTWEAKHTPNRERHQDTVELTLVYSSEAGSITFKRAQIYQYYKENDIWSVCESGDWEVTDKQWNLKEVLDGKMYTDTFDSGVSYTVTLSDLDLSAMTVTATYSYTPPKSLRSQYFYTLCYAENLKGEQVDRLSGTVKCHIEEYEEYDGTLGGYYIEEPVGSLWSETSGSFSDYKKWGDIAVYFHFTEPLSYGGAYDGVRVQYIRR